MSSRRLSPQEGTDVVYLRVPHSLYGALSSLAASSGESINSWATNTLLQSVTSQYQAGQVAPESIPAVEDAISKLSQATKPKGEADG